MTIAERVWGFLFVIIGGGIVGPLTIFLSYNAVSLMKIALAGALTGGWASEPIMSSTLGTINSVFARSLHDTLEPTSCTTIQILAAVILTDCWYALDFANLFCLQHSALLHIVN